MRNNGLITHSHFSTEPGDASYHLRLLGVLAVLVDRDVWQDALRIVDRLEELPEVQNCISSGSDTCHKKASAG